MLKQIKKNTNSIIEFVKDSPIFSYWRTILFVLLTIMLLIIILIKFNFSAFIDSFKYLSWKILLLLFVISLFQQYISWVRYKSFLTKPKNRQFFDYICTSSVSDIVPPKPLGIYYRFLLTLKLFKTNIKDTAMVIAIDTIFEGIIVFLLALISLFVFPTADLGLEIILYFIAGLGLAYILFSYYETRVYIIRNKLFRKLIEYISKISVKIKSTIYNFLNQNIYSLIFAGILTLIKYLIEIFKIYLLFLFFGYDVSFILCFGIFAISNFVGNSSGLPGGLGVFELSFVYLAKSVNIPENVALNVAIIERIFLIWIWFLFTIIYLFITKSKIWAMHSNFIEKIYYFAENKTNKSESKMKKAYKTISSKVKKLKYNSNKFAKKISKDFKEI